MSDRPPLCEASYDEQKLGVLRPHLIHVDIDKDDLWEMENLMT